MLLALPSVPPLPSLSLQTPPGRLPFFVSLRRDPSLLPPLLLLLSLQIPLLLPAAAASARASINPHDFRYVINNPVLCSSVRGGVHMLLWIHSAPGHFKQREIIRETWGNPSNFRELRMRTVFLVGDPRNRTTQALLSLESEKYGDVVQEDFVDTYRNLTYKAVMGLKWVHTYCSGATTILKADDDVVVDIFRLVRHVRALREHGIGTVRTIMCDYWVGRTVVRDGRSKWRVTKEEYGKDTYPPYCPGLALLMTADLMLPLYDESLRTPYFWVDDVYFTGILPHRLGNVTYHRLSSLVSFSMSKPENILSVESDHLFIHVHDFDLMLHIWRKMVNQHGRTLGSDGRF